MSVTGCSSCTYYTVNRGDVIGKIAQKFNVTVPQLCLANPDDIGDNGNFVRAGAKIKIPCVAHSTPATNPAPTIQQAVPAGKFGALTARSNIKPVDANDVAFRTNVDFVLGVEGGYNPDDLGQAVNFGVQQTTYNRYLKDKGLPLKNVKDITRAEAEELYYNYYYKASGADKVDDPKLSLLMFDTAVNCGVGNAKKMSSKSNGDIQEFIKLRRAHYAKLIARNPAKYQKYEAGWEARIQKLEAKLAEME